MEISREQSLAIARLHLTRGLDKGPESTHIEWPAHEAVEAMLTESLQVLGFDIESGSADFVVAPNATPYEEAGKLELTESRLAPLIICAQSTLS